MRIRLLTISHKQPGWVQEGTAEYERRLPKEWHFQVLEVKPEARTQGQPPEKVQAAEAKRLLAAAGRGVRLVALDERGDAWSTQQLANWLRRWQQDGRDVALLVGGADGLDPELKAAADQRVSLSALTLPHGLVRVVLVEQLYRASTILSGHPYHRV